MASHAAPVAAPDRIAAIDTLRGVALLGILIMNIQGFAMIEAAYLTPSLHMDLDGINWWVWALSHVFADTKFMAIFSILFGAGVIIATQGSDTRPAPGPGHFYRRNLWLLIFGLIHAHLIWVGDILVTYALCAFFIYWLRNLSARSLYIAGIITLCVAPCLSLITGTFAPPEIQQELANGFIPSQAQINDEIRAYQGSWSDALRARIPSVWGLYTEAIPYYLFWRAAGMMLIGMGLFKSGILSATRSPAFYGRMIVIGLIIGLPLTSLSALSLTAAHWDPLTSQFGPALLLNYFGGLGLVSAYIGIVMRLVQSRRFAALQKRLGAVGRMAFTNYILQSVLCTCIFYGFGLGYFGTIERWGQVLIVLAIWALQLALSQPWLQRFRFGPLEWLWRSLTYAKIQPFRAAKPQ